MYKVVIKEKTKPMGIEVDLTGPQGNAFYLLSLGRQLSRDFEMDWIQIQNEMTSGDYENLIRVFDKNFGSIVTLYR